MNYSELKKYPYKTKLLSSENDSLIIIKFPDFKNCFSKGKNLNEAIKNGYKKLNKRIKIMQKKNIPIPTPNSYLIKRKNKITLKLSNSLRNELKEKADSENIDSETLAVTLIAEGLSSLKKSAKAKKKSNNSSNDVDPFTSKLLSYSIGFNLIASVIAGIYSAYSNILNGTNFVIALAIAMFISVVVFSLLFLYFLSVVVLTSIGKTASDLFKESGSKQITFVDKATPFLSVITLIFSSIALIYTGYTSILAGKSLFYSCSNALISSLIASFLFFMFNATVCCFVDPVIDAVKSLLAINNKPPLISRP